MVKRRDDIFKQKLLYPAGYDGMAKVTGRVIRMQTMREASNVLSGYLMDPISLQFSVAMAKDYSGRLRGLTAQHVGHREDYHRMHPPCR